MALAAMSASMSPTARDAGSPTIRADIFAQCGRPERGAAPGHPARQDRARYADAAGSLASGDKVSVTGGARGAGPSHSGHLTQVWTNASVATIEMTDTFRTRAGLVLIVVLTLGTRLAYEASNPDPSTQRWVSGAMAHNIIDDGHWFQLNSNAGPYFSFNSPLSEGKPIVAPSEVDLKYADAHPRWKPFVFEPVGESVVLAGVWEVTGSQDYLSDVLMKIVLDALAALLVYHIVMRLFKRRRAALMAGFLYALYPPIAAVVVSPDRDFWTVNFTIVILAAYVEAINSTRPWRWLVACGILTGIGAYFDTGVLVLPGAMALAGIVVVGWRTTLYRAFVMTAVALLLTIPWTIRNLNDFHKFIPMRTGIGMNLWAGISELPNSYGALHDDYKIYQMVHRARPGISYLSPAYDSYLGSRALAVIESHPLFYLRSIVHRLWISSLGELDVEWMRAGTKTPFAYARGPVAYVIEQPLQLLQVMLMPLVFLLAMLSLGFTWARYRPEHLLLIALAVAIVLPYMPLSVEGRYLMPMAISYFAWIGLASDLLLERLRLWRMSGRSRTEGVAAS